MYTDTRDTSPQKGPQMATMSKPSKSVRELGRMVREDMQAELANAVPVKPAYVLRKDGDTDEYRMVGGKVVKTRRAGHVTLGMVVNPSDLPCVIS